MRTIEIRGATLRHVRKATGKTIEQLKEELNPELSCSHDALKNAEHYERQKRNKFLPKDFGKLVALARLYQITPKELLRIEREGCTEQELKDFLIQNPKIKQKSKNQFDSIGQDEKVGYVRLKTLEHGVLISIYDPIADKAAYLWSESYEIINSGV